MRSRIRFIGYLRAMAVVALAMGANSAMGGPMRYAVTELPDGIYPFGMSGNGSLVGRDSQQRNFIYHDGTVTYINQPSNPYGLPDQATAVNDSGQVGWGSGNVSAINSTGQVAGWDGHTDGGAFLRNPDGTQVMIPAPTGGSNATPYAMNDSGAVVGWTAVSYVNHPFLYENGRSIDLGLLPGAQAAKAFDINNAGLIVGGAGGDTSQPFLWDGSKLHDLGSLGGPEGAAQGINDAGQIVGWSLLGPSLSGTYQSHAFLYESGQMFDLNDLVGPGGPTLTGAFGIDEKGDIAVLGDQGSRYGYYLLTPMATVVPEPSSLVLALTFLITVTATRIASRKVQD